jgi:hypothetical protein
LHRLQLTYAGFADLMENLKTPLRAIAVQKELCRSERHRAVATCYGNVKAGRYRSLFWQDFLV